MNKKIDFSTFNSTVENRNFFPVMYANATAHFCFCLFSLICVIYRLHVMYDSQWLIQCKIIFIMCPSII